MTAVTSITSNARFATPANDETIARTKKALEANGFQVFVVESRAAAKAKVLALVPEGSEVMTNTSKTLDEIGVSAEINDSGRYDAVRPKLMALYADPTKKREMRKIAAAPDFALGSVHAITEDGELMIASASGSQFGQYAFTAGKVVWVAGAQKIVRDTAEGLARIQEYTFPLENARAMAAYGMGSAIAKELIMRSDRTPGRCTLVLIKESIGF